VTVNGKGGLGGGEGKIQKREHAGQSVKERNGANVGGWGRDQRASKVIGSVQGSITGKKE